MARNLKGDTPQERGRSYENYIADKLGAKPVKGSGNLWWNALDVDSKGLLISCKYTEDNSYGLSQGVVQEAVTGAVRDSKIPAIVLGLGDEDLICLRIEDFRSLLLDEVKLFQPTVKEQKKAAAKVPRLLRKS